MPELWQLLSGWGPHQEGSVHQAERLQGRWPWDWGRCGASGGAPSSRVGRASGRKPLPSGKGQLPVAPSLNWVGSWALSTAHPVGWGRGGGVRIRTTVSWGFHRWKEHFLDGLQFQGSQPWPRPQHCPWRRKNIPKKKPVTDEPTPCPPLPVPLPRCTPDSTHSQEAREPFLWDCPWP